METKEKYVFSLEKLRKGEELLEFATFVKENGFGLLQIEEEEYQNNLIKIRKQMKEVFSTPNKEE
jgi:hypothetical protein